MVGRILPEPKFNSQNARSEIRAKAAGDFAVLVFAIGAVSASILIGPAAFALSSAFGG